VRYWLLAGVAAFSAFALFSLAGSLISHLAARVVAGGPGRGGAASRARRLFALRMLPAFFALTASLGVALPIFLWFEERTTTESISVTLAAIAAAGVLLLARGFWRGASAWRSTARLVRDWQRRGRPVSGLAGSMPVLAIEEEFPLVAVAGLLRPRLFVAERVLRECTPSEVAAMVTHECAHVSAFDNVKRLLIRACPDMLGAPLPLERAWAAAAEEAADAAAARLSPSAPLDLAQALIRVARLAAPRAPELASAFYLGGSIDARVRLLVDPPADTGVRRWTRFILPGVGALAAIAVVLAAPSLHAAMEAAVRLLP
jgi:Zn-dependent protease with chaperone function